MQPHDTPEPNRHFVSDIVDEDMRHGPLRPRPHPLPARAQRLPAHRPRQVHLPQFRHRRASIGGLCNLRFDDTNPETEEHWSTSTPSRRTSAGSGFDWEDREYYASDYFEQLYEWAVAAHQETARPTSAT